MKKIFAVVILVIAIATTAYSSGLTVPRTFQGLTGTIPLSYLDDNFSYLDTALQPVNLANTKNISSYTSLNDAVTKIGSATVTLIINQPTTVVASLTVPSNISLLVLYPGLITKTNGTLAINGNASFGLNQVFSGFDAGEITFGSGAVKEVYPEWWGAKGDDSSDNTIPLQSAINSISETIRISNGIYRYTHITIPTSISIIGSGKLTSKLKTTEVTGDSITVTTTSSVSVQNIGLTSSVTKTSGAYIHVSITSGENTQSIFRDLYITNHLIGIKFDKASLWVIDNCYFGTDGVSGTIHVDIKNTNAPDSGDSSIINNIFYINGNSGTAIHQTSSGGLKIKNNKFLFGAYHYTMELTEGNTSDLLFQGNSSEFASSGNLAFNSNSSRSFNNVLITGNEFTISSVGITIVNPGYTWLSGLIISDNVFGFLPNTTGIDIDRTFTALIGPNLYRGDTGTTGINVRSNNTGPIDIRQQSYNNIATPYTGSFSSSAVSMIQFYKSPPLQITAGNNYVITLPNSFSLSGAQVNIMGLVQNIGGVGGSYVIGDANQVSTAVAIANIAVTANSTNGTITITNNTGQIFNGKVIITY